MRILRTLPLVLMICGMALWVGLVQAAVGVYPGAAVTLSGNGSLVPITPTAYNGDVLLAQVVAKSSATITAPTGWTLLSKASTSLGSGTSGLRQNIYYLNLTVAPASSYTWTITGGSGYYSEAVIYAIHNAVAINCAAANTTSCAASYQSGGGSSMIAPNVGTSFSAGAVRLAFFASANGTYTITRALENSATAWTYSLSGSGTSGVGLSGSYYLLTGSSNGDQQTATLSSSANQIASSLIIAAGSLSLTCYSDNFDRTTGVGSDWAVATVNGSFTPSIVSNRLRMTDTGSQESTAVSLQKLFPGASNYLQMTFKYYGYGGSGADGMAVILSDGSVTPKPGGFGGSLGYAPKASTGAAGFAGGWLGLGLDEFGNFSNKSDSGACAPSVATASCATSAVAQSVSLRGSSSTYYWLTGTGRLATSVSNTGGHLYRVTVDSRTSGSAYVTVERDTSGAGNAYSTLISAFNMLGTKTGQSALPSDFILSLTGSTGDYTNTHEIDDLTVCAQYMNAMTSINHYRFAINTALTCTPAAVTVTACMDANCTSTYSGNVTATLTATTASGNDGWVAGTTQTFAGSGATLYLQETTAGTYSIGVSASTPVLTAYSVGAECSINGSSYSTANCSNITFADSGLLVTVPNQTSGVTSTSAAGTLASIAAVKKSDNSLSCVPAFASVTRCIKLWSGYASPATGTKTIAVNGTAIGTSSGSATAQSLTFDSTGKASGLTINYADAGQVSLNAAYVGSSTNSDAGLSMTGSASFVTVPYALCLDSPDSGWNCTATSTNAQTPGNCNVFTKAGSAFNVRVTGKAYTSGKSSVCDMNTTPNYAETIPLTSTVYAPTGGSNGSLGTSSISITSDGTATVSTTESEVGDFTLAAVPGTGDYFGATAPSGSAVFGRFKPAGIAISGSLTNRSDFSCSPASSFTYLGETLKSAVTLAAVNSQGGTTTNYTGNFALLPLTATDSTLSSSVTSVGLTFGVQSGTTLLNSRLSATCKTCGTFSSGLASISVPLTVARSTAVDGPFPTAQFGLSVLDSDGVGVYSPDYNWDLTGAAEGKLLGTTALRFGRMRLENAYGSPLLKLNVPAYAQYWNGTSFQKNTDDSCTQLSVPTSSTVTASTAAALYCSGGVGLYGTLAGVTASMNGVAAGSTATLSSGDAGLWLSKPTNTGGGYLDVAPAVPAYLKYNWDGVANSCSSSVAGDMFDDNPRARVRFGVPRNDKIIYLREVY